MAFDLALLRVRVAVNVRTRRAIYTSMTSTSDSSPTKSAPLRV